MKVLLTGVCGFVGCALAKAFTDAGLGWTIFGLDNFSRNGSEINRPELARLGVKFIHADIRCQCDIDALPEVDWVIDCAANPSVLAGVDGQVSSRQLVENNLTGTINLLEYCKTSKAGFIMLSTSRVYSIECLSKLPVNVVNKAFQLSENVKLPSGVSSEGIDEQFSTMSPISLYGACKLSSETMALEYGSVFGFPVWINRCGVMAGAGQFGRPDQGIFAYWINCHLRKSQLKYIGFDGKGYQVRDCLHPSDLALLLKIQIAAGIEQKKPRMVNVSGGKKSAMSLLQLTEWCNDRFGSHTVSADTRPRPFDLPWVILDSRKAIDVWTWAPQITTEAILEEIALHASKNPNWLQISSATGNK